MVTIASPRGCRGYDVAYVAACDATYTYHWSIEMIETHNYADNTSSCRRPLSVAEVSASPG